MNKYFSIVFISSGDSPSRQLQIKKTWAIALLSLSVLLSTVGYFWFFSQNLAENPADTHFRKKIARKNLKLTQRILKLSKSHHKYSEELKTLENNASQTMEAAGVNLNISAKNTAQIHKTVLGHQNLKKETIGDLFKRLDPLNSYLDSTLEFLEKNQEELQQLPTLIPVSKTSFIIREFGRVRDPFSGKLSYHTGVDFSGEMGDSVFAPGSGRVISTKLDAFYGKTIRISHNKNIETFLAHLQSIRVKPGNIVKKGQFIGTLGRSGKTTGPHLHFEILVGGEKINPTHIYLFNLDQPFLAQAN